MNKSIGSRSTRSSIIENMDRREFLKKSSGLTFCIALGGLAGCADENRSMQRESRESSYEANAWVNIATSGIVTIMAPADEMGQGSSTALPLILAEELDVRWEDVRIEISPADEEIYGNPKFFQLIYTIASKAVTGYFDSLRLHGAQVRRILLDNVAGKWGVPVSELTTEPSVVVHEKSGRRLSFGEIAKFATPPEKLPEVTEKDLKSPDQFRLIGKSVPRRDVKGKVLGTTEYAINANPPGLVYATAVRAPIMGATVARVDEEQVSAVPGVIGVFVRETSVVVAADTYFHALSARRKLKIEWNAVGEVNQYDSDLASDEHARLARDMKVPGTVWDEQGDIALGFSSKDQVFEREYRTDYLYYAQIEPLNATVWVKDNGAVEAWVGTQAPAVTVRAIAKTLDVTADRITLHREMIGGGFGRRSISEMDYVVDSAWLSAKLSRPVKVIWSREDDVAVSWHKPMTGQFLRAAVNDNGEIKAWHHRIAVQEPLVTAEPHLFQAMEEAPLVSMTGSQQPVYNFTHRRSERIEIEPGIRTYALLGVGNTPNQFASESFIDEIAEQLNKDPLEFRRGLLASSPRALNVLNTVAEQAEWGKPRKEGKALGLSFCQYDDGESLLAGIAEISADLDQGSIQVHNFWIVVDPGLAVQPDNVRAQMEGAVTFGLGGALSERTTFKDGLVQQSNFHDYSIPRISDVPNIHVEVISDKSQHPHAVGQIGAIPVAPAIANAFAALTGARLRHMPFTPDRVKQALEA